MELQLVSNVLLSFSVLSFYFALNTKDLFVTVLLLFISLLTASLSLAASFTSSL